MEKEVVFLTEKELAERWKVHPGTIKSWRLQGKGPPATPLTEQEKPRFRYALDDVIEYEKKMKGKLKNDQ